MTGEDVEITLDCRKGWQGMNSSTGGVFFYSGATTGSTGSCECATANLRKTHWFEIIGVEEEEEEEAGGCCRGRDIRERERNRVNERERERRKCKQFRNSQSSTTFGCYLTRFVLLSYREGCRNRVNYNGRSSGRHSSFIKLNAKSFYCVLNRCG